MNKENMQKQNQETNDKQKIHTLEEFLKDKKHNRKIKSILGAFLTCFLILVTILAFRIGTIGATREEFLSGVENTRYIEVTSGDIDIEKKEQINMFQNVKFDNEKIIAPMSYGKYDVIVENVTGQEIEYHIKFIETTSNDINMKYRLKMDNVYIRGNENDYLDISELDVENIIVAEDSITKYTVEWYWENSDEADTLVGSKVEDQQYMLEMVIEATNSI